MARSVLECGGPPPLYHRMASDMKAAEGCRSPRPCGVSCPSKQFRLLLFQRRKTHPMDRTWAEFLDRGEVLRHAVAFVSSETVAGKFRVERQHHPIARDLGEYTCGGDGITARITFHQRGLRLDHGFHWATVHEDVLGLWLQLGERLVHGAMRGLQDVDAINRRRVHDGDGVTQVGMCGDDPATEAVSDRLLLLDIFFNPFRPLPLITPTWLTANVVATLPVVPKIASSPIPPAGVFVIGPPTWVLAAANPRSVNRVTLTFF